jgi:DNA-3-methyladenine glycosylase I
MGMRRCGWVPDEAAYIAYHDAEWGTPSYDDNHLFEMLTLEGAQAGLSWRTILNKRAGYRTGFAGFDPSEVARYSKSKVEKLLKDQSIVRNRLKVESTVNNAKAILKVQREFGSLSAFLWGLVKGKPRHNNYKDYREIPAETQESRLMSQELKKRGFTFVGPAVCYAFMQAVGMVNDHEVGCFRYKELRSL